MAKRYIVVAVEALSLKAYKFFNWPWPISIGKSLPKSLDLSQRVSNSHVARNSKAISKGLISD